MIQYVTKFTFILKIIIYNVTYFSEVTIKHEFSFWQNSFSTNINQET
jgi:hypothetical protein